ncbi:MAG: hypothetical protein KDD21_01975 [Bacteroidetes bacterium]|nr:hypothetical protein [Bacteroidota bacterium]
MQLHKNKILKYSRYKNEDLDRIILLVTNKIKFININLIPNSVFLFAEEITKDVDIDDTEFVALTEHIKGKLWTGDKELINDLISKKWNKFISTNELYEKITRKS